MPFDALALHAVADEMRERVVGGRVQRAFLADDQTLVLEVYGHGERHWLLASAHPEAARAHLVPAPPARATERVTPFLLLIRKYVRDARLTGIEQPALERVLEVRFAHRDERGLHREVRLVLELMGRRSNFVLIDEDDTILDALKRVSRQANPVRPLLPHLRYTRPPQLDRLDPRLASSYFALEERVAAGAGERTLAQLLVAHLAGLSPVAAEEVAYRATGEHRAPLPPAADRRSVQLPWPALQQAAAELFGPIEVGEWEPHLILRDGAPADATPYRPRQFPADAVVAVPTMSEAFARLYSDGAAPSRGRPAAVRERAPHDMLRRPLEAALSERRAALERKVAALERSLESGARAESLRRAGEAVLASLHTIAPGQAELVFEGQQVALDPDRSPLENAQRYFDEYTRARDATRVVPELIDDARLELRYLDEMHAQVLLAEDAATLEQLRRELVAQKLLSPNRGEAKRGRAAPPKGGFRRQRLADFELLLGTSAVGNDRVTFELASPEDIWLHARGVPGSHVVLRTGGRAVPAEVIEAAARLAARHSTARGEALVIVDWTARKHVRKIRGAPPGLVTYTHEQTLRVRPDAEVADD